MTTTYLLHHEHAPAECASAFAAWRGCDSPLRHGVALASCRRGGHQVYWTVQAGDAESALALLPAYVAERTRAVALEEVVVP